MRPPLLSLIAALAAKDWRLFWGDRRAALLTFAVPIALASVFGLIFSRHTESRMATRLPIAIVVEDDGPFTQQVAVELLASPRFEAIAMTREQAEAAVAERRPSVAIVLPRGFEK